MIARRYQLCLGLLTLAACQDEPTQTHILLAVHVGKAIEDQVTSVVVHGEKRSGETFADVTKASTKFEAGDTPRFVLQPAANQAQLQLRVVALHDRDELASALIKSRYSAGRGLYLDVELGCDGAHDLGEQDATSAPSKPFDNCDYEPPRDASAGAGGKSGSGGSPAAGSGGKAAKPTAGAGGSSGAGAAAGGGTGGTAGASGASEAGTTGTMLSPATEAGAGGAGEGGAGGAGAGGAGAGGAGAGGAGSGGAGAGAGTGGREGCYTWYPVDELTGTTEIETLDPAAFLVGTETRDDPEIPTVKQYVCQAAPSGMTAKLVGKASKWGCYLPGPGSIAYTVTKNVEVLNSSNSTPCLAWKPLSATQAPTSPLIFGDGAGAARACYVAHSGPAEGHDTSGPRVGQVRLESNQYVCRFEFYYSEHDNMTLSNRPDEDTRVLDYAP